MHHEFRNPSKPTLALIALLVAGCAGNYSLREQAIRSKLPADSRSYTNGIISNPTDVDVQASIALGTASKDNDTLDYAYITKAPRGAFASDEVYVRVATPLYLIARHAKEQTREYRKIDDGFVQYARGLEAVKISISQQYISTVTWDAYAFQRQVALLRDGVRVEPLQDMLGWAGQNPFSDKPSKQMQAALAEVSKTAAQVSRSYASRMTREQKAQALKTYRSMGLSEDQVVEYTGFSREEIREVLTAQTSTNVGRVALSEFDGVYPIGELKKPGRYELVFRTPPVASLYARGDKEVRFPISFSIFR